MKEYVGLALVVVLLILIYAEYRRSQNIQAEERRRLCKKLWGVSRLELNGEEKEKRDRTGSRAARKESHSGASRYFERVSPQGGIDAITWDDLELDRVFAQVNHTFSDVGEEYLYFLLRTPLTGEKELLEREERISCFQRDPAKALCLQELYLRMGHSSKVAVSDALFDLTLAPDISGTRDYLCDLGLFLALLLLFSGITPALFVFILLLVYNILSYYKVRDSAGSFFRGIRYLVEMTRLAAELAPLLEEPWEEEKEVLTELAEAFASCRRWSLCIALEGGIGGSFLDVLLDYLRILLHVDLIAYAHIRRTVQKKEAQLHQLLRLLGYLESCMAIASYRESCPLWCVPSVTKGEKAFVRAKSLAHPLVFRPVTNDVDIEEGLLITGSNASGKSTFLRAVAVNVLLAQTIHTAVASSFASSFCRLLTSMNVRDQLERGESYYMAEIRQVGRMFTGGELPLLCVIDEVLRGTGTVERIAASSQILRGLSRDGRLVLAATHDGELTYLLKDCYENAHFSEEIRDGDLFFPYLLRRGCVASQNAIRLLAQNGYPAEVVTGARRLAQTFLETGSWRSDV